MITLTGKVSWFGGPDDTGVDPDEGLAFIYEVNQAPHLFLSYQPEGTTGLARRLNPEMLYIACRWDYNDTPRDMLLEEMAIVRSTRTGKVRKAYPADWGPHEDTDRVADISPGLMDALGITTDDEVEVLFPGTARGIYKPYSSVVISSGHGKLVRGASGVIDEVDEARRVVDKVAEILEVLNVEVKTFHDDTSTTQNENLNAIVDYHNAQKRDLDVSVHFNAYVETNAPMGTECLYVSQASLADQVASALAAVGFINRGGKKRTDLFFLNQTEMPSILIEICFCDSTADCAVYQERFTRVCRTIAGILCGKYENQPRVVTRATQPL